MHPKDPQHYQVMKKFEEQHAASPRQRGLKDAMAVRGTVGPKPTVFADMSTSACAGRFDIRQSLHEAAYASDLCDGIVSGPG